MSLSMESPLKKREPAEEPEQEPVKDAAEGEEPNKEAEAIYPDDPAAADLVVDLPDPDAAEGEDGAEPPAKPTASIEEQIEQLRDESRRERQEQAERVEQIVGEYRQEREMGTQQQQVARARDIKDSTERALKTVDSTRRAINKRHDDGDITAEQRDQQHAELDAAIRNAERDRAAAEAWLNANTDKETGEPLAPRQPAQTRQQPTKATTRKWLADNQWYSAHGDPNMRRSADALAKDLVDNGVEYESQDFYNRLNQGMQKLYPNAGLGGAAKPAQQKRAAQPPGPGGASTTPGSVTLGSLTEPQMENAKAAARLKYSTLRPTAQQIAATIRAEPSVIKV